ncbi:DMT family transporter [Celerinatantimonas diazotrophica]|uniref:EamA domain-containing membrane protein RarD n=1 Tax=Celerinatantimonas diazotrophica TaxID=412034 RepID=A0A4R1KF83_9GAMM|nr:DMT family transporter [Celerinatantimonas diazotrophica]TCK62780.1 EamA domain-containing membrane protein RarD [Celerinatantimonas diazotrophica]CAG9298412.1 putative cystine transporter YijE [Celerinatantimonas diazotrophica]
MKKYLYLTLIGLLWGAQFVFMRQAVAEISDVWVAAGRAITGALTLWILCAVFRFKSKARFWPIYLLIALVDATLPFLLLAWAQKQVDSSVSAVIMGMIPLLTLLFAPIVIAERLRPIALVSVLLGFAGIWVLFAPQLQGAGNSLTRFWPLLAILASAGCYALGMLLVKRFARESPLLVARNILSCAAIELVVVALIKAPAIASPSTHSLVSLLMLGVLSTGFGYFVFMALIALSGPTFASMSNYLVPVIGFLLGGWLLNERPPHTTAWALLLILLAIALNQWGRRVKRPISV